MTKLVSLNYSSNDQKGAPSGRNSRRVPATEANKVAEEMRKEFESTPGLEGKFAPWKMISGKLWETDSEAKDKEGKSFSISASCQIED